MARDKYVVRDRDDAYKFSVSRDLGHDAQGGHWFKEIALFTYRPAAEKICQQLNDYGLIYLPGKCEETLTAVEKN